MTLFEILFEWILSPLLDMVSRWHISGKWHLSYLLVPVFAVFAVLLWLGKSIGSVWLMVIGLLGVAIFGLLNLLLFLPRILGEKEDFDYYLGKRRREAEKKKNSDS